MGRKIQITQNMTIQAIKARQDNTTGQDKKRSTRQGKMPQGKTKKDIHSQLKVRQLKTDKTRKDNA